MNKFAQDHQRSQSRQASDHWATVIGNLRNDLAGQMKKFAEVLQNRTKSLKEQSQRRKEFASTQRQARKKKPMQSLLPVTMDEAQGLLSNEDGSGQELMQAGQLQVRPQQANQYYVQRTEAVEQIEKTIHELTEMYQKLSSIVAEHEELCIRIDANVEEALDRVTTGQTNLSRYLSNIQNNRWLMIKVFVFLIIFSLFFVIFIA